MVFDFDFEIDWILDTMLAGRFSNSCAELKKSALDIFLPLLIDFNNSNNASTSVDSSNSVSLSLLSLLICFRAGNFLSGSASDSEVGVDILAALLVFVGSTFGLGAGSGLG